MRSKHFLAFVAASVSFAALSTGCGSDDSGTGGAGTTTTASSTASTTASTSDATSSSDTTSVTSTTSTGTVDDGNNSFDTAETIDLNSGVTAELDTPDLDVDYYKFTGTKGMPIAFLTDAKPDDDPYADGYMDLVITIFDSSKTQIAQNDDPFPRDTQDSKLYTVLPEDGDYYIKVEEFCETDLSGGNCPADYFDGIFEYGYAVNVFQIDGVDDMGSPFFPSYTKHGEPANEDPTSATAFLYTPVDAADPTQGYYSTIAQGNFDVAGDTDFYAVDFPDGLEGLFDPLYSVVASVAVAPGGTSGSGSTSDVGLITLWNNDGSVKIAEIDASKLDGSGFPPDLTPPVTLGQTYILQVSRASGGGANDFYFASHSGTQYSNQPEVETTNENDTAPETLDSADGLRYFIAGTLLANGDMVDRFKFDSSGGSTMTVSCGAQRSGSGLRGFKFEVLDNNGNLIPGGDSIIEDDATDVNIVDIAVAGAAELKITAASQDAMVKSNFYRCGLSLTP